MKLYLGAGQKRLAGYVHVDIVGCDGIDVIHDLDQVPWPWADDSVEAIVAEDLVEHLNMNLIRFCNEAWRVLAPGGELFVRTPHHTGDSSWIDPTHRWHLNEQAFHYLDPDTYWGTHLSALHGQEMADHVSRNPRPAEYPCGPDASEAVLMRRHYSPFSSCTPFKLTPVQPGPGLVAKISRNGPSLTCSIRTRTS